MTTVSKQYWVVRVAIIVIVTWFVSPLSTSLVNGSITTMSPLEDNGLSTAFKDLLQRVSSGSDPARASSSSTMSRFMRNIYSQVNDPSRMRKRRKRQADRHFPTLTLSDDTEMIISLPNSHDHFHYHFDYNATLKDLAHVELILPIQQVSLSAQLTIVGRHFNLSFQSPLPIDQQWIKINLTPYVHTFPQNFTLRVDNLTLASSGFLTLYFQRVLHSVVRRDLSSPDPSACQVRPFRVTFAELNWTSWIVEPTSFEMNVCTGTCSTAINAQPYSVMQALFNRMSSKSMSTPCCRPNRFSSTILLYYDGPNLILKRFENMRVVQCTCA